MTKKKPRIRFAGFDDDWEQRKLGDVGSVSMCHRVFKEQTSDSGDIPFYKIGTFGEQADAYISNELFTEYKKKYAYPQKGDILISASGSIGRIVEFTGKNEYFQDSNIVWLSHDNRLDNLFLKCFYSVVKWAGIEESTIKRLYNDNILNTVISMPIVNEQKKIGTYFTEFDKLITLHQNKYDKLTNIKKAMLEKMFPKNGANVPEIRFKGFSDDWERRKLEEVVDIYDGVHQTPEYKDSGIMFLSVENITTLKSNKYISEESFKKDYKVYPQKGDILMTRIGDVGTPNVVETMEKLAFYVSLALLKPTNIESYFLCNAIQSSLFQKRLRDRTLITAIPQKINKEEIGKIDIILSTFVQEQRQIGAFFKQLDKLIALHQKRVEKLQSIKKACIEKMFV